MDDEPGVTALRSADAPGIAEPMVLHLQARIDAAREEGRAGIAMGLPMAEGLVATLRLLARLAEQKPA